MARIECHLEHWYHPEEGRRFADPRCRLEHWPHPPRAKKVRVERDTGEVMVSRHQQDTRWHPYQQTGDAEWRVPRRPRGERNMSCCGDALYNLGIALHVITTSYNTPMSESLRDAAVNTYWDRAMDFFDSATKHCNIPELEVYVDPTSLEWLRDASVDDRYTVALELLDTIDEALKEGASRGNC